VEQQGNRQPAGIRHQKRPGQHNIEQRKQREFDGRACSANRDVLHEQLRIAQEECGNRTNEQVSGVKRITQGEFRRLLGKAIVCRAVDGYHPFSQRPILAARQGVKRV
jgi:hypothetical protein